jgi:hypothetical protein
MCRPRPDRAPVQGAGLASAPHAPPLRTVLVHARDNRRPDDATHRGTADTVAGSEENVTVREQPPWRLPLNPAATPKP